MNEIIKPHSFEDAKQHIQAFSSRTSPDLGLDKVKSSGGLFGWFDHNVTGDELNMVTSQVQNYLIKFNGLHTDFIKEFGQVYKALESLDKEYIPAILSAVKGAEEASNQAKTAQADIRKTIDTQKKVIDVLSDHKKKLDKYKHLENIDEIWRDIKSFEGEMISFKGKVDNIDKQLDSDCKVIKELKTYTVNLSQIKHIKDIDLIWADSLEQKELINELEGKLSEVFSDVDELHQRTEQLEYFKELLEKQQHIAQIDEMWADIDENKIIIKTVQVLVNAIQGSISDIKKLYESLKKVVDELFDYAHLSDIDIIWQDVENQKLQIAELNKSLSEKSNAIEQMRNVLSEVKNFNNKIEAQHHLFEIDTIYEKSIKNADAIVALYETSEIYKNELGELRKKIQDNESEKQIIISRFTKNITIAYVIAGSAVGVSILEFVLNILGII